MAEEQNMITQGELDRILTVFSNVHKDNDENEKLVPPANVSLSQVEVDTVLSKGIVRGLAAKAELSMEEAARIRARKIAARKAHSAQILAQVNADSPRRVLVSYGSCLKKNLELEHMKEGDSILLDRKISEEVKVFVDGKLFAKGLLTERDGMAAVKLIKLASKENK
ncbi:MAG: FliM/FliN family flagellar motor C-terminal domain-containing protein [Treponema sp.]|nr:FliM/FliN family flagellar motor C-terminal domain-containing protein [Treponema sp.]